jgi:hypothetical protein
MLQFLCALAAAGAIKTILDLSSPLEGGRPRLWPANQTCSRRDQPLIKNLLGIFGNCQL